MTTETQNSKPKTQNSPSLAPSIDYEARGSILSPLKNLSFFGRPAVTEPLEPRLAALRYRGFHLNDWEKCVGCSTCQKVCDNAAISMVNVPQLPDRLWALLLVRAVCRPVSDWFDQPVTRVRAYLHGRGTLQLLHPARPKGHACGIFRRRLEQDRRKRPGRPGTPAHGRVGARHT